MNGKWAGRYWTANELPIQFEAVVPGCAHTDLLRAGMVEDYLQGYAAKNSQFIEKSNFEYSREFDFDGNTDGVRITFQGLDTFCDVYLNEQKLGYCDDMFIPHSFDVSSVLKQGRNQIRVRFYPPTEVVSGRPELPAAFTSERVHIRRMQCTFGWDWVDRFVTMGIIGDVMLEKPSATEIDCVYVATTHLDEEGAEVYIQADFETVGDNTWLEWEIVSPQGETVWQQRRMVVEDTVDNRVSIAQPQLWWPIGYGEQPLYTFNARVLDADGVLISEKNTHFGIRTLRILETFDKPGSPEYEQCLQVKEIFYLQENDLNDEFSSFVVLVNGKRVFCKGANWVPCEPFPSDARAEKYRELLRLAADAHMNMIRVWGGGIFENDIFYEECDRLGILVTQDFLMACAHYPEDQVDFLEKLRMEAAHAAKRLRNHPCLAWWTGDNENGGNDNMDVPEYPGRRAALLATGPVLKQMDPYRRFQPSSPYGGKPFLSVTQGNAHNTFFIEPFFKAVCASDLTDYHTLFSNCLSRFNSELPLMGTPPFSSLKRFLSDEQIRDDECLRFHTKNNPSFEGKPYAIFDTQVTLSEKLLGDFESREDQLFKMQYIQYEWVRYTMEAYRRNKWFSAGTLFWMFNDCWPANGWALVDYYCNPKAGYYAFKNFCRPVIASVSCENGEYTLHVSGDGLTPIRGTARLYVQSMTECEPLWETTVSFDVEDNAAAVVWRGSVPLPDTGAILLCDLDIVGEQPYRTVYFPCRICDLGLSKQGVEIVEQTDSHITLKARAYVHAVGLDGDYCFEDNFFPLTPGEIRCVKFTKTLDAQSDTITVRCL